MRIILYIILSGILVACSPHKVSEERHRGQLQFQEQFDHAQDYQRSALMGARNLQWYKSFNDLQLNQLMSEVMHSNLSLKQAWARLAQARAAAGVSRADLLPELNATASGRRTKTDTNTGNVYASRYSSGTELSWEIDLWQRIYSSYRADEYAAKASLEDLQNTMLLLTQEVTSSWIDLIAAEQLVVLLEWQIEVQAGQLELIEAYFGQGQSTALDVIEQRAQLDALRGQLPSALQMLEEVRMRLAILAGREPSSFRHLTAGDFPKMPAFPPLGNPKNLMDSRPDLRTAFMSLMEADYDVAAAVAAQLPVVNLVLSYDHTSSTISDLFRNPVATILGSIAAPLFDGGQRANAVLAQKWLVRERFYRLQEAILNAIAEVETSLLAEKHQYVTFEAVGLQLEKLNLLVKEYQNRYLQGNLQYLDVIDARLRLQNLQQQAISEQADLLKARINLYAALGGSIQPYYALKEQFDDE